MNVFKRKAHKRNVLYPAFFFCIFVAIMDTSIWRQINNFVINGRKLRRHQTITNGPLQREVGARSLQKGKSQKTRFYMFWGLVYNPVGVSFILDHLIDLYTPLSAFKSCCHFQSMLTLPIICDASATTLPFKCGIGNYVSNDYLQLTIYIVKWLYTIKYIVKWLCTIECVHSQMTIYD